MRCPSCSSELVVTADNRCANCGQWIAADPTPGVPPFQPAPVGPSPGQTPGQAPGQTQSGWQAPPPPPNPFAGQTQGGWQAPPPPGAPGGYPPGPQPGQPAPYPGAYGTPYAAYAGYPPPTARADVGNLRKLLGWIRIGFLAYAALSVLDCLLRVLASAAGDSGPSSSFALIAAPISFVRLAVQVGTYVVLALWMYRCAENVRAFGIIPRQTWAPIWAWFVWLVPCASWVLPPLMLREIRNGSGAEPRKARIAPWWTLWLASQLIPLIVVEAVILPKVLSQLPTGQAGDPGAGFQLGLDAVAKAAGFGSPLQIAVTGIAAILLIGAALTGIKALTGITEAQEQAAKNGGYRTEVPYLPTQHY